MWIDLPSDILATILSRLSVKQAIQCTLINKSYYQLIHSKFFVDSYNRQVQFNRNPSDPPLMFFQGTNTSQYKPRSNDKNKLHECAPLPLPFRNPSRFTMLGSSNGLVCLYNLQGKQLILWNPYIQRSLTLPKFYPSIPDQSFFGLGFVDETSDYKVLMINQTNEAQIYSLQHNCWKIIANPGDFSTCFDHPRYFLGSLYWISSKSGKSVLRVFDLNNEVFGEISLPDCLSAVESSSLKLMKPTESSIAVDKVLRWYDSDDDYADDDMYIMDLINDKKWRKYSIMDDDSPWSWTGTMCVIRFEKGKVIVEHPYGRVIGIGDAFVKSLALFDKADESSSTAVGESSRAGKRRKRNA